MSRIVWPAVLSLAAAALALAFLGFWLVGTDVHAERSLPVCAIVAALLAISFAMLALREPR